MVFVKGHKGFKPKQEFISVILATYNREEYIAEAIESVIKQSWKNWELIIVNDGSTDNSMKVINYYVERYRNIHVYTTRNHGQARARNTGIEYSKGDYIAILDSDDFMNPDRLRKSMLALRKKKVDCVFSSYYYTDIHGKFLLLHRYSRQVSASCTSWRPT
jgi:glycosyltransferase involved in cell wall biosynthesis